MAKPGTDDPWGLFGEPATEVKVTVSMSGPTLREQIAALVARLNARITVVLALVALAIGGSVAAVTFAGGRSGATANARSRASEPAPAGVASAYGYPLRCLSAAIALHHPRFARADFDRILCGRYDGYPTAIFAVRRWWRVRSGISYSCPPRLMTPRSA